MSGPTCGTCKFRGPDLMKHDWETDWEDVPTGFFQCERINHEYKDCPKPPGTKAFVIDGSDYFGKLCVSEDFGCTEYQPKGD